MTKGHGSGKKDEGRRFIETGLCLFFVVVALVDVGDCNRMGKEKVAGAEKFYI